MVCKKTPPYCGGGAGGRDTTHKSGPTGYRDPAEHVGHFGGGCTTRGIDTYARGLTGNHPPNSWSAIVRVRWVVWFPLGLLVSRPIPLAPPPPIQPTDMLGGVTSLIVDTVGVGLVGCVPSLGASAAVGIVLLARRSRPPVAGAVNTATEVRWRLHSIVFILKTVLIGLHTRRGHGPFHRRNLVSRLSAPPPRCTRRWEP